MNRTATFRPYAHALLLAGGLGLALLGCSSSTTPSSAPATSSPAVGSTVPGSSVASNDDPDAQLAQAKTVAVGFFEAQAVNDWAKALDRSSGAAALTIKWAQAVNTINAANDTPYQVPSVTAPNVRVQLDSMDKTTDGRWAAKGFVELSFRPGPVVSTTAAPSASSTSSTVAGGPPPATFAVDLVFTGAGDALKLDDYRLDDTPYPVSQLFMQLNPPAQDANGASGTPVLAHRDLDGSVQYALATESTGDATLTFPASTFSATTGGPGGTAPGTTTGQPVQGKVFADPLKPQAKESVLVVYAGLFPGSAGILTLEAVAAPGGTTVPGTTPATTTMRWTLPDFPPLTPRPLHTVASTSTTSTSSTTTSSTTSTTAPGASSTATVIVPLPPTVSPSSSTTTTTPRSTTTSSSSTTTTSTTVR